MVNERDKTVSKSAGLLLLLGIMALFPGGCKGETAVDEATREGILIMGNTSEPKGLDPHIVSGVLESNIIGSLFEGLVVQHPSRDGVALPGVAKKWYPTDSKHPDEWIFELRKDSKWSDGKPLTAEDFLFSFRRILTPELASDYAFMLFYIRDAEPYHKSQRAYLLFRDDKDFPVKWESLKKVDFGPNEKTEEKSFNRKGLDHLNAKELKKLLKNPELFEWPEKATPQFGYVDDDDNGKWEWNDVDGDGAFDIDDTVTEKLKDENGNIVDTDDWEALNRLIINKPVVSPEVCKLIIERSLQFAESGGDLWDLINFGATAPDPHTLKVKLNAPLPFLPEITKHYTWFPVPEHVVLEHGTIGERFTDWTKPANLEGNGPFKLKSWRFNDHIQVQRNPNYWDAENVGINGIRYLPISNLYTEDRMFFDGQLHITYTLAPDLIEYSRANYPQNVRNELYLGTYFIRTNVTRKPFDDKRVRLAFSMALDQRAIIDNVLQGGQKPAGGLVPPFGGYPTSNVVKFDPEVAQKLLAEAGFPGGKNLPDIEFLTTDRESSKRSAEAMQAIWKKHLGANIKITQMEWTSYITNMFDRNYDLAAGGWIGDYMDPLTFLDMWMKGAGNNRTGWSNEQFEKLLHEASGASDPDARYTLLSKAESLLLAERPILPLYWYTRNYLIHPDVKGWHPLLLDNHPYKFLKLERNDSAKAD